MPRTSGKIRLAIARNSGLCDYRPLQAKLLAQESTINSRNVQRIWSQAWKNINHQLGKQISPLATSIAVSQEAFYRYVYSDKAFGGQLLSYLRFQKKRRKRYGSGPDRHAQIIAQRIFIKHLQQPIGLAVYPDQSGGGRSMHGLSSGLYHSAQCFKQIRSVRMTRRSRRFS